MFYWKKISKLVCNRQVAFLQFYDSIWNICKTVLTLLLDILFPLTTQLIMTFYLFSRFRERSYITTSKLVLSSQTRWRFHLFFNNTKIPTIPKNTTSLGTCTHLGSLETLGYLFNLKTEIYLDTCSKKDWTYSLGMETQYSLGKVRLKNDGKIKAHSQTGRLYHNH